MSTFTPLLGAELRIKGRAEVTLAVDPEFEHGVLVDSGDVQVAGTTVERHELAYLAPGRTRFTISAADGARVVILGGRPFGEKIIMWWNFVARSNEEIAAFRRQWQAEIGHGDPGDADTDGPPQFGPVPGWGAGSEIPAPALPHANLLPRG